MSIFKACDIRGKFPVELDASLAYRIGRAVGTKLRGGPVILGGDLRLSTPELKAAVTKGLVESGCQVKDLGTVPTPVFYFALRRLTGHAGVMVTASHNPKEYNGFKLALGPMPVTEEDIQQIKQLTEEGNFINGKGKLESLELTEEYLQDTLAKVKPGKGLKVVIDASNGSAWSIAPHAFELMGYKVTTLNCEPDGSFPGHPPNPAVAENLQDLCRKVVEEEADVGIAFDGDGDRVGFVDNLGQQVPNDKNIVIFVKKLLSEHHGAKVVYDIKCSSIVPESVRDLGGIPLMEKSGYTFIKRRMLDEKALFGGEITGHFFYDHLGGGDDALYSSLLMAQILTESTESLSELVREIPTYCTTPDLRIPVPGEQAREILTQVQGKLARYNPQTIDGVRVEFPEGWGLMRISVTEPLLTFRFEGKTPSDLEKVVNVFLSALPEELGQQVESRIRSLYRQEKKNQIA